MALDASLPGSDLIVAGLEDLKRGATTVPSLLVRIAAPRLRRLGIAVPPEAGVAVSPEHELYALLAATDADSAHSRYNALIRRLVSFERASECAR